MINETKSNPFTANNITSLFPLNRVRHNEKRKYTLLFQIRETKDMLTQLYYNYQYTGLKTSCHHLIKQNETDVWSSERSKWWQTITQMSKVNEETQTANFLSLKRSGNSCFLLRSFCFVLGFVTQMFSEEVQTVSSQTDPEDEEAFHLKEVAFHYLTCDVVPFLKCHF